MCAQSSRDKSCNPLILDKVKSRFASRVHSAASIVHAQGWGHCEGSAGATRSVLQNGGNRRGGGGHANEALLFAAFVLGSGWNPGALVMGLATTGWMISASGLDMGGGGDGKTRESARPTGALSGAGLSGLRPRTCPLRRRHGLALARGRRRVA